MSGGRSASWIDALLSRTTSASCACCIAPIARSVSVSTGGHLVSTASVAAAFSRCSLKKLSSKFRGSFFFFGCGSAGWICPILVLLVGSMAARVHGAEREGGGGGQGAGRGASSGDAVSKLLTYLYSRRRVNAQAENTLLVLLTRQEGTGGRALDLQLNDGGSNSID